MIPTFALNNGLMVFQNLDRLKGVYVYSLAWRFTDNQTDAWSYRLISFKNHNRQAVRGACQTLSYALSKFNWASNIAAVAALPSGGQTLPTDAPLYELGEAVAHRCRWQWRPNILSKVIHRKLHYLKSAYERDDEVANKYKSEIAEGIDWICIIDDLVTRGSTINEIIRALKEQNPNINVFAVVLGKNESQEYALSQGVVINNDHVSSEYVTIWDGA